LIISSRDNKLYQNGFNVHLVKDAVCSRTKENWKTACDFMRDAGAVITCTESVLFQLLKIAGTEEFKMIAKRIKYYSRYLTFISNGCFWGPLPDLSA